MIDSILYIDPICPKGHVNFNKIHIEALLKISKSVNCVFKEGYAKDIGNTEINVLYEYPVKKSIFDKIKGLGSRIRIIKQMRDISKHVDFRKFEIVILSYYDELSFVFSGYKGGLFLINHNNIAGINSSLIKRFIYKQISKNNHQLVFDSNSWEKLQVYGINDVQIVNHGLIAPYKTIESCFETFKRIRGDSTYTIFMPSSGNVDDVLVKQVVTDINIRLTLEKYNAKIIMNCSAIKGANDSVKFLNRRLSFDEYSTFFCNSDIILIPYPKTYSYRTSGVLMESIANDKRIQMTDIAAFRLYENLVGESSYFNDVIDLSNHMEDLLIEISNNKSFSYEKDALSPNYSFLYKYL